MGERDLLRILLDPKDFGSIALHGWADLLFSHRSAVGLAFSTRVIIRKS
jgi:hypothetical protein